MTPSAAVGEVLLLEVAEHLARVPIPGMNATARAVYSDKLLEQCLAALAAEQVPREPTEAMQMAMRHAIWGEASPGLKLCGMLLMVRKAWRAGYDAAQPQALPRGGAK